MSAQEFQRACSAAVVAHLLLLEIVDLVELLSQHLDEVILVLIFPHTTVVRDALLDLFLEFRVTEIFGGPFRVEGRLDRLCEMHFCCMCLRSLKHGLRLCESRRDDDGSQGNLNRLALSHTTTQKIVSGASGVLLTI